MEKYPTTEGVPDNPYDLGLEKERDLKEKLFRKYGFTTLRLEKYNNHHASHPSSRYGSALMATFRNLDPNQYTMPVDLHDYVHERFDAPEPPTPQRALEVVSWAFETGVPRKYGSVGKPEYKPITVELMDRLFKETDL